MLDFGVFTLPAVAAAMVFVAALFVGEDIVIEKVYVPQVREWTGYTSTVATRILTDELRELSVAAASELQAINIDEGGVEKGISAFEDYFEVGLLINGTRNVLGLIKYYINGEITEVNNETQLIIRIYTKKEDEPVKLIVVRGKSDDLDGLLHEGGVQILEYINPYVIALYHRRTELAAKQFDFPKTNETIKKFLETQPPEQHFLAYGLLGRMNMLKAERDTTLTPEQRQKEYDEAVELLDAALRQQPDFLYPLINLGIIYAGRKEYDRADEYFARAVKQNPNYLVSRTAWGDMLIERGLLDDAVIQYEAAVLISPHDDKLQAKLADLYERTGQPEKAQEQIEKALKLNPISQAYLDKEKALEEKNRTTATVQ
ncbi:Tetratricopeptide TPR_2 repeat protein [Ancylobacter novellus DSM 506]|uniref:Tetratricopeptide TPR_2 repeat protein n=1 Tax=Ancylobacter novellus (strain ATCC 8093 / DSM 506 / JCM 20403 / CCM 1077 / IAM 12100 / NBRC 12443 / NCIMB 10456) TaxID=639283 RepID=D7A1C2_ANCN5|nr:tetratricopeptide repeat protein [Ancylobacter novellus]ADH89480.1 Tetratricopeptide TPR_2 repeat protein [Ancylobacter novellus DSM 506]